MAVLLQAASREALGSVGDRLDAVADAATAEQIGTIGVELFAVVRLLDANGQLRRHLGDPSAPAQARAGLVRQLLGGKQAAQTVELVEQLASATWSRPGDLVDAAEVLARRAILAVAEKQGNLDDVEDELFRFSRILEREPQFAALLADITAPAEGRVGLLQATLGTGSSAKVSDVTYALLAEAVRTPRGRRLDDVAAELAEEAAARRKRSVAKVVTPVALTEQQEARLVAVLGRMYGRAISLQVELDPSLLGGLVITIGDELIDGSLAAKLAAARRNLPT
ncbi:F-type H+-transporting ATPase subunit delta [Pseudonocardia thermophila]|uniref:ATP synthase subunit delta n=1 Tax=Pseudonocardia thermophila TaxID=1848 RepID=A0A1M6QDP5_PSETH|nr:F0F1 ATP synthase subunit delta [Pseudonocardia thermophila]SHK18197.1 F-type H+-transporting ATPase subunit delta [Pseudonocardia thermophila]